jgi:hypothetical protein
MKLEAVLGLRQFMVFASISDHMRCISLIQAIQS